MSPGMRSRQELKRNVRAPERDRNVGAYVLMGLIVVILVGLAVDAFMRPVYWIGMP